MGLIMLKEYITPEIEIIEFNTEDIITTFPLLNFKNGTERLNSWKFALTLIFIFSSKSSAAVSITLPAKNFP